MASDVFDMDGLEEVPNPDSGGSGLVTIPSATALMALNKSEIDMQIATAKEFPRSLKSFVNESTQMVTLNEEIAGECMYALKRGGKTIEGPSARFAEIIASSWGNCRIGARIIGEDERFVTSQGVFFDLQRNVSITYETRRRITYSDKPKAGAPARASKKFDDDMIGVTANAASSIAMRNAVLKGIPKAFWKPIYDKAKQTAIGKSTTLAASRLKMLDWFAKAGASVEQVIAYLEVPGVEDIGLDHLALMRGVMTRIKDSETTVDDEFGQVHAKGSKVRKSDLKPPGPEQKPAEPTIAEQTASVQATTEESHVDETEYADAFNNFDVELSEASTLKQLESVMGKYVKLLGPYSEKGAEMYQERRRELSKKGKPKDLLGE